MSTSERIPCSKCGAMILPSTADFNGGYCMPCSKTKEKERMLINHNCPPNDVLVSVEYQRDSWDDEVCGWIIQISNTGLLRQVIKRSIDFNDSEEELEVKQLSESELKQLLTTLEASNTNALQAIEERLEFDDVDTVSLHCPAHDLNIYLQYHFLADRLEKDLIPISDLQKDGFNEFSAIWNLVDSLTSHPVPQSYLDQDYDEIHKLRSYAI